jgi:cold shock CspA family protein
MTDSELYGIVKFFNNAKGWGLITGEDGATYFVHHSNIVDKKFFPDGKPVRFRSLKTNQKVIFVRMETEKQMHAASNVRIAV